MKYVKYLFLIAACFATLKAENVPAPSTTSTPTPEEPITPSSESSEFDSLETNKEFYNFSQESSPQDIDRLTIEYTIVRDKENYNEELWAKIHEIVKSGLAKYPDLAQADFKDVFDATTVIVQEVENVCRATKTANDNDKTIHGYINLFLSAE